MVIFASAGLECPPSFQEEKQGFDASGAGQRMKEALWFIHKVFPPQLERRGQWEVAMVISEASQIGMMLDRARLRCQGLSSQGLLSSLAGAGGSLWHNSGGGDGLPAKGLWLGD